MKLTRLMMAPSPKNNPAKSLEIVLACSDDASLEARFEAMKKAAARAGLKPVLTVTSESGLPQQGARSIRRNPGCSDWSSLLEAASPDVEFVIFWPASAEPDAEILAGLLDAAGEFDWVGATRGEIPSLAASILSWGLGLPPQDFGAPCLVRSSFLVSLKPRFDAGDSLLGPRLARAATGLGAKMGQLPPVGQAPIGSLEALGVDRLHGVKIFGQRSEGLAVSAALASVGLVMSSPAVIALALFGLGFLGLGYFFGKPE